MEKFGIFFITFLALLSSLFCFAEQARGELALLAKINNSCGGGSGSSLPYTEFTAVSFTLGVTGAGSHSGVCDPVELGCDLLIPIDQLNNGDIFEFYPSDIGFTELTTTFTNGIDESITCYTLLFDASQTFPRGGGVGNYESRWFLGSPDLQGRQIKKVRLIVNDFVLSERACCGGGGFQYQSSCTWEFWGTGNPAPRPAIADNHILPAERVV
jgi:hypothetical protein